MASSDPRMSLHPLLALLTAASTACMRQQMIDSGPSAAAQDRNGRRTSRTEDFVLRLAPTKPVRFSDEGPGTKFDGLGSERAWGAEGQDDEENRHEGTPSEASTIRITPPRGPTPEPLSATSETFSCELRRSSATIIKTTSALGNGNGNERRRNEKEVVFPNQVPKTIGQWAALTKDVRAITPMPSHKMPRVVNEEVEMRCWNMFRELRSFDQRRVVEVVERSWREGDEIFLSRQQPYKMLQINWDNLSPQCIRNVLGILDYLEYETFLAELREANTWKEEDEEFEVISDDEEFVGIGWYRRGFTGRLEVPEGDAKEWRAMKKEKPGKAKGGKKSKEYRTKGLAAMEVKNIEVRSAVEEQDGGDGEEDVEMIDGVNAEDDIVEESVRRVAEHRRLNRRAVM